MYDPEFHLPCWIPNIVDIWSLCFTIEFLIKQLEAAHHYPSKILADSAMQHSSYNLFFDDQYQRSNEYKFLHYTEAININSFNTMKELKQIASNKQAQIVRIVEIHLVNIFTDWQ